MQEEDVNKVSVSLLLEGSRLERIFESLERIQTTKNYYGYQGGVIQAY
tara:strand:- start:463 stop:606 length:144 start_codon:yes stop_codon:yes gene_type:complete